MHGSTIRLWNLGLGEGTGLKRVYVPRPQDSSEAHSWNSHLGGLPPSACEKSPYICSSSWRLDGGLQMCWGGIPEATSNQVVPSSVAGFLCLGTSSYSSLAVSLSGFSFPRYQEN